METPVPSTFIGGKNSERKSSATGICQTAIGMMIKLSYFRDFAHSEDLGSDLS